MAVFDPRANLARMRYSAASQALYMVTRLISICGDVPTGGGWTSVRRIDSRYINGLFRGRGRGKRFG